ncbi:hypothetical protein WK91_34490 [Burkholderia cepacia]|uniref:hypothetical protein n=1 Tax=Burkholderia cepacia TaxID=292 RepID=UPI00075F1285|nr:hypothetical protein [Burkholderia cepacia]KVW05801.1 hypothetical protein WK91_34490 [Burkholderia cepacia]
MADDLKATRQIAELIREATSLFVVSNFLKARNVASSAGTWDDMINKRLIPRVEDGTLNNGDLLDLLRSVEECGRQHVFLYFCPKARAQELMDRKRVGQVAKSKGLEQLLVEPLALSKPAQPQLVDIRWETAKTDISLTVKEVETRTYQKYVGTRPFGDELHKIYARVQERAINLAKLHRDGLLEIRIAAHSNSTKYETDVARFWNHISAFLPRHEFTELSLSTAKDRLWTERKELSETIRYTDSTIRNEAGNLLKGATGNMASDLLADTAVSESLDYLLEHDDAAYCDGANIWFRETAGLSTDIHVLLGGEVNEFALPANCTEEDYRYVVDRLRSLNRGVSGGG